MHMCTLCHQFFWPTSCFNRCISCVHVLIHHTGIVFNNLEGDHLEYTLRLRHEVGEDKSWETRDAAPNFQPPGPRVTNKSVSVHNCRGLMVCIDVHSVIVNLHFRLMHCF